MLTIKELQSLIELLNKKEETLQNVQEIFLSKFKDTDSVFRASYAISNLLLFNLLTSLQRIPAIFLLIENYKHQGIKSHPFGATIFQLVHDAMEPFERVMISDIIIDQKREQYSRFTVEYLYEKSQSMIYPIEERVQIKHLQDKFLENLPQMNAKCQSQVKNVVRDCLDKQREAQIPQYHVNLNGIKESQIGYEAFNIGFMRPIPKFINIEPSQFHWFSPGVNIDIQWDRTTQAEIKLAKAKCYLKKAVNQHLTKDESTQIQNALDSSPNAVLHLEVSPEMIGPMIKQTPYLVYAYLVKLSNFPIFDSYLQLFLEGEITLNMIDVVSRIIKAIRVPSPFILLFTNSMMQKVIDDKGNGDRDKLARYVVAFVKNLKKLKIINMEEIQERLNIFLQEFKTIYQVNQLQQIKASLAKE